MILRFALIYLISVSINQLSFGQENTIYLKSGAIETAQKVDIIYNPIEDDELSVLNSDGKSKLYKAADVDSVHFRNGQKYYTESYQFYYKTKIKTRKSTFVRIILSGTISLYENDAFGNNLFIEKEDEFFQLNKPSSIDNNELVFGQVKFYLLQQCLSQEEVVNLEFNRNAIINAINKFNECDNVNYIPKAEAKEKRTVKSFSVFLGGNFSSYNFISSVVSLNREGTTIVQEGINTEGSKSQSPSINIEYLSSIFRFQRLYVFVDLGYTKFDYALLSDDFSSVQNIKFDNFSASIGPVYRLDLTNKISSFTKAGVTFNFNSKIDEISAVRFNNERVVVIPENIYEKVPVSVSLRQSIDYNISKNTSLVLRGDIYFGNGGVFREKLESYYNNHYGFIARDRRVTHEDSIKKKYLISIGIKYSFTKKGFY